VAKKKMFEKEMETNTYIGEQMCFIHFSSSAQFMLLTLKNPKLIIARVVSNRITSNVALCLLFCEHMGIDYDATSVREP
jgi:hypothetical protein